MFVGISWSFEDRRDDEPQGAVVVGHGCVLFFAEPDLVKDWIWNAISRR
jgi:hypothetical protein